MISELQGPQEEYSLISTVLFELSEQEENTSPPTSCPDNDADRAAAYLERAHNTLRVNIEHISSCLVRSESDRFGWDLLPSNGALVVMSSTLRCILN